MTDHGLRLSRQVDGAKVMAQGRADGRRRRQHGRDAGQDGDVQAGIGRVSLGRLEHRRGHGKDAGITGGHDHNPLTLLGHFQSMGGALGFDPVVRGVQRQAGARGNAGDIRDVADDVGGIGQGVGHLGRHHGVSAGAKAHDDQ